jgi:hypothetical protein
MTDLGFDQDNSAVVEIGKDIEVNAEFIPFGNIYAFCKGIFHCFYSTKFDVRKHAGKDSENKNMDSGRSLS